MKKGRAVLIVALGLGLVYVGTLAASGSSQEMAVAGPEFSEETQQMNPQSGLAPVVALASAFTYQGRLTDGGSPANGPYDFEFLLFDDPLAGNQVGNTVALDDVAVVDGLFAVELDFGQVFDGQAQWLEIRVRPGSDTGGYTILSPRQELTAAPYAHSLRPGATISGPITSTQQGVLNLGNGQGHGLFVSSVDNEAIMVSSAGGNGIQVDTAAGDGLYVGSVGADGAQIFSAGGNGVLINSAGINGVKIVSADDDGVEVDSAVQDGFQIDSAGGNGLLVNSAGENGVDATSTSALDFGGYFQNTAPGGRGVYAEAGDDSGVMLTPDLELGGTVGVIRSDSDVEGALYLIANGGVQVDLDEDDDSSNSFVLTGNGGGSLALIVDETGNTTVYGNHTVLGTKSALVQADQHGPVKLYALESPENWFEDFGSARLVAGEATVTIEPVFAATVNLERDYHVFLTPLGDCALYVAEKTATSFTVRAQGGAQCSIAFDYRIVAKRLGYEDLRLEQVNLKTLTEGE